MSPAPATDRGSAAAEVRTRDIYVCTKCGNCCRWPGYVRLTDDDLQQLAAHLAITEDDLIQRYTELTASRRALTLKEQADGSCTFFREPDVCTVHAARPRQCRRFPTDWNFPGFEAECPAIPLRVQIAKL